MSADCERDKEGLATKHKGESLPKERVYNKVITNRSRRKIR